MMQKHSIIGLTGGSGSGKSTAAGILREKGGLIIDADKIGHEIMKPKSDVLAEIEKEFGEDVIDINGGLDRKKLGAVVFANDEKLKKLNKITHPRITSEIKKIVLENIEYPFIVIDTAVLVQCEEIKNLCDKIIVVCADHNVRINRIVERDNISYKQAENRINSQMPQDELLKYADIVWYNNGSVEDLKRVISDCY
jgi:dephospho-CoA kinase